MSPPISAEARGRLRLLCQQLEAEASRLDRAVEALPPAMLQAATKKGVSSRRAVGNIIARMPIAPVHHRGRAAVWRTFRPAPSLPGDAPGSAAGAGVVTEALLLNAAGREAMTREPFGFAATMHALGRLLDRSGFDCDPLAAMIVAHDALLLLGEADGRKVLDLEDLTLPAGSGIFLCTTRRYGPDEAPLVRAQTWIEIGQLRADQSADLARWSEYLSPHAALLPLDQADETRERQHVG